MAEHGDPIARFREVFARAREHANGDPTAAALATADAAGRPSARMVLLKGVDERGFVFYTSYDSRKARDLEANPRAALCFYWSSIDEQVRVEGAVERVSPEEADAYFGTRPRLSQIATWASDQSAALDSRARLVARFLGLQVRYAGRAVPRPSHWGGFRVVPQRIEFWSSRPHRLHDRTAYTREAGGWRAERLYP